MTNWKILKEMGIPDHRIYLLRNLYMGQEATVRTGHGEMHWFKIGKGVHQGCLLSHCLFKFYAEYIMRNAELDESSLLGEISITSNMQMTLPLWQKVKKNQRVSCRMWKRRVGKVGLKLNIQKTKIMERGPITSWQIDGEQWKQWQTFFSWAPKSLWIVTAAMKLKDACSLEEKLWQI